MKWLLLLLPIWVQAQTLKPDTYHNLKPTEPIVLDTGCYTFSGLEMHDLGEGIWLDGRKAREMVLLNCRFEGHGTGTGVVSSGTLVVQHCRFTNMACGIWSETERATTQTLTLTGNTFTDLATSISLNRIGEEDPATLNFTLRCNEFINEEQSDTPITRRGLVIGEGVALRAPSDGAFIADEIGGQNAFDVNNPNIAYPNGNVWPTTTDRDEIPSGGIVDLNTSNGWGLSPNWVSIENNTTTTIKYYGFVNEFIGYDNAIVGFISFPPLPQAQWIVTGNQDEDATHVKACANFTDPVVLFPVLRIAVLDSNAITSSLKTVFDSPYLLDAIPNPAQQETKIGLYLPQKTEQVVLQIVEFATGKVLQNIRIQERGKLETVLDVSKAPAGIYGYRLVVNGKPEAVKKIVVMH